MDSIINKNINEFISKVKEKYPNLYIEYEYDENLDEHIIWHNDSDLQFSNKEYSSFVGGLKNEMFYENGIANFSFGYDYFKAEELYKTFSFVTENINIWDWDEYIEIPDLHNNSDNILSKIDKLFKYNTQKKDLININDYDTISVISGDKVNNFTNECKKEFLKSA